MDFKKPGRQIMRVFIHCSASDRTEDDNVTTITAWHKARGFETIGYHYYINKSGIIFYGRDLEKTPAAQINFNTYSIAICLGGLEKFTSSQFSALRDLCQAINKAYRGNITFHGHCEVSDKACPVFDYRAVLGLESRGKGFDDHGFMPLPK